MLGQQVLRAEIADVLGITNIVDIAGIADQVLRTLRWKQVGVYKVSWGCPVTYNNS